MRTLSKTELKKQLINLGVEVHGNYVRKSDLIALSRQHTIATSSQLKHMILAERDDLNLAKETKKAIRSKDIALTMLDTLNDSYEKEYTINDYKKEPDKILQEWVEHSINKFLVQLEECAKFKGDSIYLYRKLGLKNLDQFLAALRQGRFLSQYTGMGSSWGFDRDVVSSWGFNKGEGDEYIFHGILALKDIDIKKTLIAHCHPQFGDCEYEIMVKKGAPVEIIRIEDEEIAPIKTVAKLNK